MDNISDRMKFAEQLLRQSGNIAHCYFRQPLRIVDIKDDDSKLQTECDLVIERFLREHIADRFPNDGWLGEETGARHGSSGVTWVVDPIDGTLPFAMGKPTFTTTIALQHNAQTLGGLIYQPIADEMITGFRGANTEFNGVAVQTSDCQDLRMARICTNPVFMFKTKVQRHLLHHLPEYVLGLEYGGDSYSYLALAAGFVDCVIACGEAAHDFAAACPIIEGAGGLVTDWRGASLPTTYPSNVLACANASLHQSAIKLIVHFTR